MAKIEVRCPECSRKYRVDAKLAGRRARCKDCDTRFELTAIVDTDEASGAEETLVSRPPDGSAVRAGAGSDADALVPWEPGMELAGDYEVERQLGHGGMGDVYLVRSRSGGERLAVKRILPSLVRKAKHRQAFLGELRTWIDLPEHPHVTSCRFFRTVENQVIVFAEYVDGGSLEHWIRNGKLSTVEQVLDVAIQFAWGLEAAHAHGLGC